MPRMLFAFLLGYAAAVDVQRFNSMTVEERREYARRESLRREEWKRDRRRVLIRRRLMWWPRRAWLNWSSPVPPADQASIRPVLPSV